MPIRDEYRPLDSLIPDPANYNVHSKAAVAELVDKIITVGFTSPILVDAKTGLIVAGHRRRLALLHLREKGYGLPSGIQPGWMIPCRVGEWSEVERLKVLIGDNPRAGTIDYDAAKLSALLCELQAGDTLDGTGYDSESLDKLIGSLADQKPKQRGRAVGVGLIVEGEPPEKKRKADRSETVMKTHKGGKAAEPQKVCCPLCHHHFVPGAAPAEDLTQASGPDLLEA